METSVPTPEVDAEQVLSDIAKIIAAGETGDLRTLESEVRETEDVVYLLPSSWQKINDSLLRLHQGLELAGAELASQKSWLGRISSVVKSWLKRLSLKGMYWYVNPIQAQVHSLHYAATGSVQATVDELRRVHQRLSRLEDENLERRLEKMEGERTAERIGRLERTWRERAQPGQYTASAGIESEATGSEATLGLGKDRVADVERHRSVGPLNFDYYWFESIHRGDRDLIKKKLQPYAEYFIDCNNVLDIGCGRGEFIEVLKEKGIGCYGIDVEPDAVEFCNDRGLNVMEAEALEYLASLEDESIDGIFVAQVAEHLTPSELIELVGLIHKKLKEESYVVIETPNPQCLLIFASFFYADLSHVQPIHPETMKFLLLSTGFKDIEVKFANPVPKGQRLKKLSVASGGERDQSWVEEMNANIEKLNSVLYGYMDYAAVAKK